jgi:predicted nucleic acid-binding protein
MLAIDANILLYAYAEAAPDNQSARNFIEGLRLDPAVAISEFTLAEFYLLLRNPVVLNKPLSPAAATGVIDAYRRHPQWRVLGFPPASRVVHDELWRFAKRPQFARRRLYDVRTALSLLAFGVTEFATANIKDFKGLGFKRVWNPLKEPSL